MVEVLRLCMHLYVSVTESKVVDLNRFERFCVSLHVDDSPITYQISCLSGSV